MKKFICAALVLVSMLDLQALQLGQYYAYQNKKDSSFSKSFDESTDLIRGIISLREGIFEQQRLYGNIDFIRMKSDNIGTCSYADKGLDAMMQLLILTHPSSGGSGFNAEGSGSIGQVFAKKKDDKYSLNVIKIIATMFKIANETRQQTAELLKDNTSLPSDEIKKIMSEVKGNIFQKLAAVNNIKFVFNEADEQLVDGVVKALKANDEDGKTAEENERLISDAKNILSETSGKTYAQLVEDIRNLERDIDEQNNEKERLKKEEIQAYRKKIIERNLIKGQLAPFHDCENSIKETIERSLSKLDTLNAPKNNEDVEKLKGELELLRRDIAITWENMSYIPDIRSIISSRKEVIARISNTIKLANIEKNAIAEINEGFLEDYNNQLDQISRNIEVNDIVADDSLLQKMQKQKKALESILSDLIKKNSETLKQVTNFYDIKLNIKNKKDHYKVKKLIELTDAVSGAVLLERYDKNENRDDNHPYWLGYTNNIICTYACKVISGESADAQLEELAARIKNNRLKEQGYTSDLTTRLFQERKASRSVIPFDVGITPITNNTTVFKGNSYADCVETTMRQFFSFLFSKKIVDDKGLTGDVETDLSRIPNTPDGENLLRNFFAPDGNVLDIQSLANDGGLDVREKWSNICSGHADKGIWYSNSGSGGYELQPDWNSMIKLFCLLMKDYPKTEGADAEAAKLIDKINANPDYQLEAEGENSVVNAINTILRIRKDVKFEVKGDSITELKINQNGRVKRVLIGAITVGLDPTDASPTEVGGKKFAGPSIANNNLVFEVEEKHAFLHRIEGKTVDRSKNSIKKANKSVDEKDTSGYFHIKDLYEKRNEAFLSGKKTTDYTLNDLGYPILGYFARIKSPKPDDFHRNFRDMLASKFGGEYLNGIAKIMLEGSIHYTSVALRDGALDNANFLENTKQLFHLLQRNVVRVGELSGPISMMLKINGKYSSEEEKILLRNIAYDLFDFAPNKIRDYLLRIDGKGIKPLDMFVYELLPKYEKYTKGEGKEDPHPLEIDTVTMLIKTKSALRRDVYTKLAKEYHDVLINYVNTNYVNTKDLEDTTDLLEVLNDFMESENKERSGLSKEIENTNDRLNKLITEKTEEEKAEKVEKRKEEIKKISDQIYGLKMDLIEKLREKVAIFEKVFSEDGITENKVSTSQEEKEIEEKEMKEILDERSKLSEEIKKIDDEINGLITEKTKKEQEQKEEKDEQKRKTIEEEIKKIPDRIYALRMDLIKKLKKKVKNLEKTLLKVTEEKKSILQGEKEILDDEKQKIENEIQKKENQKVELAQKAQSIQSNIDYLRRTLSKKNDDMEKHISSYNMALGKILSRADLSKLQEKDKDTLRKYMSNNHIASFVWNSAKYVNSEKIELILPITRFLYNNAPKKEILRYILDHKSEKYGKMFAEIIEVADNKTDVLNMWWKEVPPTENFIDNLLGNNNGNDEVANAVIDYYKENKTVNMPISIFYQIWTDFSEEVVLKLIKDVKVENSSYLPLLEKLIRSPDWKEELRKTCRDGIIREAVKKISIADLQDYSLCELMRYPLSEDVLCAIADNLCLVENIENVVKTLMMDEKSSKIVLKKMKNRVNERFKNKPIPLGCAALLLEDIHPEQLEKTLKRIDFNLSNCSYGNRSSLRKMMNVISHINGVNKSVENWGISLCQKGKIPLWFAIIIRNYLSERLVNLIDLGNINIPNTLTTSSTNMISDISKILEVDSARPIFIERLFKHHGKKFPVNFASSIITDIPASEIPEFLNKVRFRNEDEESFKNDIMKIMDMSHGAEKIHQIGLFAQKYYRSKNKKLPKPLAECILLSDNDIEPFMDDFPPNYPTPDDFAKHVSYFCEESNFIKANLIINKLFTVDRIDLYASQLVNSICRCYDPVVRNLLVKKISEKHKYVFGFLMCNATGSDGKNIANLFSRTTEFDTETFNWRSFMYAVDNVPLSSIPAFVKKIGNELKNMPINLIMFVTNNENRQRLANEICRACKGMDMPYSLSTLCFMSDKCLQEYFNRLDKSVFNKNDVVQLLSDGTDRDLPEDIRSTLESTKKIIEYNKEEMKKANAAAEYVLQNITEDCSFDKQTIMKIVKAIRKGDIEFLKAHLSSSHS